MERVVKLQASKCYSSWSSLQGLVCVQRKNHDPRGIFFTKNILPHSSPFLYTHSAILFLCRIVSMPVVHVRPPSGSEQCDQPIIRQYHSLYQDEDRLPQWQSKPWEPHWSANHLAADAIPTEPPENPPLIPEPGLRSTSRAESRSIPMLATSRGG